MNGGSGVVFGTREIPRWAGFGRGWRRSLDGFGVDRTIEDDFAFEVHGGVSARVASDLGVVSRVHHVMTNAPEVVPKRSSMHDSGSSIAVIASEGSVRPLAPVDLSTSTTSESVAEMVERVSGSRRLHVTVIAAVGADSAVPHFNSAASTTSSVMGAADA